MGERSISNYIFRSPNNVCTLYRLTLQTLTSSRAIFRSFSVEMCWYFDIAASLVANHESVSTKCVNCLWKSIHLSNEILRDFSFSFSDDDTSFQSPSSCAIDCLNVAHFSSSMFSLLHFRFNSSTFPCFERNSRFAF